MPLYVDASMMYAGGDFGALQYEGEKEMMKNEGVIIPITVTIIFLVVVMNNNKMVE